MRKILMYAGLIILPFIGYWIDLWNNDLHSQISQTFNPFPTIVFTILFDIVFAAIVFWLVRQTARTAIPAIAAVIYAFLGLAVICIPLLFTTSLFVSTQFFTSWLPVHRSIAGAILFVTGLAALFWRPKPAEI